MPKKTKSSKRQLPPLLAACQECFKTTDLYKVIGIRKEATPQEVKKGYHKKSLAVHPDRVEAEEKEEATRKFQTLGKVYALLSDKDKRAVYDETGLLSKIATDVVFTDMGSGEAGEEDVVDQDRDWCEYWRLLFPKVTVEDIEEFESKYKGSEDELADLKTAYMEGEGDMDIIMDSVLCSTADDEERFVGLLTDLINSEELPKFDAFVKESAKKKSSRQRRAAKEAEEAEEEAKKLKLDDSEGSLSALILQRNSSRAAQADSFFANLEAKYCKPQKGKKKK